MRCEKDDGILPPKNTLIDFLKEKKYAYLVTLREEWFEFSESWVFRLKIALSGMQYGFQGHSSDIN